MLRAVRVEGGYTNLVLPAVLAEAGLSGRDAAFVTELASGTIRRRATYDAIIEACLDRPLRKVESVVLDCLRLGAHQLLAMRVPSHAAISTTVDLARQRKGAGAGGFANAVLRRVAEHDLATWIDRVAPARPDDLHGRLAIAESHPRWVVDELATALGEAADELEALLAADNEPPRVTLVARPGLADPAELPGRRTSLSPFGVELGGGDPAAITAVAEGRAGVQDEGSQLVALALAGADVEGRDERWIDLCAGPGGKAALLAALAAGRGAGLVGTELHHHRAALVARSAGAGLLAAVQTDATRAPFADGSVDRVLLDAPCTGLGALRRRPEARWRRSPGDLGELVDLQRRLLAEALRVVRPGGVVLYATCSPVLSETSGIVAPVLEARPDVVLEDAAPALRSAGATVPDRAEGPLPGTVQLWPHRHGTDAMFLALLRRR